MTVENQNIIAILNIATIQVNRYLSIIIYLIGTMGNILNIIVLSQRNFRSNSCAFLFLISSIASLTTILVGLTNRVIACWIVDFSNTLTFICKFRAVILFTARWITIWSITLATADRWLLSCADARRRQTRSLRNARRGAIFIIICSFLFNTPIIYCYEANLINTPVACYGKTAVCRILTDMTYGLGSILIPTLTMTCFSLMIILNVRRVRRRITIINLPVNNVQIQRRTKRKDRQLLIMLLVQVLCTIILTFPQAIQKLYSSISLYFLNESKSKLQNVIEQFTFDFVVLMTYFASSLPFYIYALSSGCVFRDACLKLFKKIGQKLMC